MASVSLPMLETGWLPFVALFFKSNLHQICTTAAIVHQHRNMEADTNLRTVGCRLEKLIPDAQTVSDIRMVVQRVHEATIQATSLLNLHVRRCIHDGVTLRGIFNGNWIKAFQEVVLLCQHETSMAI